MNRIVAKEGTKGTEDGINPNNVVFFDTGYSDSKFSLLSVKGLAYSVIVVTFVVFVLRFMAPSKPIRI